MSNEITYKRQKKIYISLGVNIDHYKLLMGIAKKNDVSEQYIIRSLIAKELRIKKLIP